jgi:hypothetical protein
MEYSSTANGHSQLYQWWIYRGKPYCKNNYSESFTINVTHLAQLTGKMN